MNDLIFDLIRLVAGIICLVGIARWTLSVIRRQPSEAVELYQFQDSSYSRRVKQAWHLVGEEKSIAKFVPGFELERFVRVSWNMANERFIGTYKKRFVSRLRGTLRERGAKLVIHYERPSFLEDATKEYHFGGRGGGRRMSSGFK